jgi:hypothetical protein
VNWTLVRVAPLVLPIRRCTRAPAAYGWTSSSWSSPASVEWSRLGVSRGR